MGSGQDEATQIRKP